MLNRATSGTLYLKAQRITAGLARRPEARRNDKSSGSQAQIRFSIRLRVRRHRVMECRVRQREGGASNSGLTPHAKDRGTDAHMGRAKSNCFLEIGTHPHTEEA